MVAVHRSQPTALRSLQELQVPGQVRDGPSYVAGISKVQRAEAHHRGRRAPRGRRSQHAPQIPGPHQIRCHHARTRRHPRHRFRAVGQQGLEFRRRRRAPSRRSPISARTSSSTCSTRPARRCISYTVYRCWVSEYQALPDLDANANAVLIQHIKARERGLGARPERAGADAGAIQRTGLRPASWTRSRSSFRPASPRARAGGAMPRCGHCRGGMKCSWPRKAPPWRRRRGPPPC